jgi:hypothetical protein
MSTHHHPDVARLHARIGQMLDEALNKELGPLAFTPHRLGDDDVREILSWDAGQWRKQTQHIRPNQAAELIPMIEQHGALWAERIEARAQSMRLFDEHTHAIDDHTAAGFPSEEALEHAAADHPVLKKNGGPGVEAKRAQLKENPHPGRRQCHLRGCVKRSA